MRSFTLNSTSIIRDIEGVQFDPATQWLVSMDIESLYTKIPQTATLEVVKDTLAVRTSHLRVPDSFILWATKIALTRNFFKLNDVFYAQVSGTAMGATFAPTLANLYVDRFEHDHIYAASNPFFNNILIWRRYIDDILIVWQGTEELLCQFHVWINSCNPHLRFTLEKSHECLPFLDLRIKHQDGHLVTTLFKKDMDRNAGLHYGSFHPTHLKRNLPFGQFLRIRRNCSSMADFDMEAGILFDKLTARGYPKGLLKRSRKRAKYSNRDFMLSPVERSGTTSRMVFVSTFSTCSFSIQKVIRKHWHVLNLGKSHFQRPLFAYKRSRNLKDVLVHSRFSSVAPPDPGEGPIPPPDPPLGHAPCGGRRCTFCSTTSASQEIDLGLPTPWVQKHNTNCNSDWVVYVIWCPCSKFYIGKTERKIRERLTEHRSRIKRKVLSAPLVPHCVELSHSFEDLHWSVIEQVCGQGTQSLQVRLHEREQRWILRTNCHITGLNDDLDL